MAQTKCFGSTNKKYPPIIRGYFLFFGDNFLDFWFWFWRGFGVVIERKIIAVFFEQNFDTTSDRYGDDGADKTKHVDADCDGAKDNESWELETFALNFWRNKVGFDLKINDGIDKEANASRDAVKGEKERNKTTTDE